MSSSTSMNDSLHEHYQQLKQALLHLGYFRHGTLLERLMPCGKPNCACHASPPRLHGPYYQWTRKLQGKTVTVALSPEQAHLLAGWIATGRELNRILAQMQRLSFRATERLLKELPPPVRKKPLERAGGRRTPKR